MAGRYPLPDNVKALKGTLQPCRVNKKQPNHKYLEKAPPVPQHLKGIADKPWKFLARRFTKTRVLTQDHLDFMEVLAVLIAELHSLRERLWPVDMVTGKRVYTTTQEICEELIKKNGDVFRKEYLIPHPDVRHYSDKLKEFRQCCVQFGMTPATSSKLIAQADIGIDPDEFDPF